MLCPDPRVLALGTTGPWLSQKSSETVMEIGKELLIGKRIIIKCQSGTLAHNSLGGATQMHEDMDQNWRQQQSRFGLRLMVVGSTKPPSKNWGRQ